jgi:hypothetical protein
MTEEVLNNFIDDIGLANLKIPIDRTLLILDYEYSVTNRRIIKEGSWDLLSGLKESYFLTKNIFTF